MTTPAGFALLHIRHGKTLRGDSGRHNTVMTVTAGEQRTMLGVAERDSTGVFDRKDTICRCTRMTFVTAAADTESGLTIMTGPAGATLFHLRHRMTDAADSTNENRAVTFVALEHLEMN